MEVGFIGLTVAAFGILSDAAGKYTLAIYLTRKCSLRVSATQLQE